MSRWFRHYAGMMRDDKLVSVAIKSKQPVERVVWVWGAILESAAEIDDDGRFNLDAAEVAYFLRADEADIGGILAALVAADRVSEGRVVKWGDRQFTSDRSADRQAKYRERKRSEKRDGDKDQTSGDGGVTSLSRHGDAPETETEADISSLRSDSAPAKPTPRDHLKSILDAERSQAVIEHRKRIGKPLTAHAAKILAGKFALCPDPNLAADTMVGNGWQGFEPAWMDKPNSRGSPTPKPKGMQGMFGQMRGVFENGQADDGGDHGASGAPVLSLPYRRQV